MGRLADPAMAHRAWSLHAAGDSYVEVAGELGILPEGAYDLVNDHAGEHPFGHEDCPRRAAPGG